MHALFALVLAGCALSVELQEPADMALTQDIGVSGLYTDPNPHKTVKGALSIAREVVFRRPEMAEPRPGFKRGATVSLDDLLALIPFAGDILHVGVPSGGPTATARWSDNTAVNTEAGAALSWATHTRRGQEARKNLYLTTSDAVRKLTSATDTGADRAGLPIPVIQARTAAAGTAIENGKYVAWRAVVRRTDANGLVIRGAPSGRMIFLNSSGAGRQMTVRVYFSASVGVVAGDVIELYRTRNKSVTPLDELFLAVEATLSSTNISNGFVDILDNRLDADLVLTALYTNPSREGIERQNVRPPLCTDMALFNGSLFFSRITWPHRMILRWDEGGDALVGLATGIGVRSVTGDLTLNSNSITNVSNTTGLQIGQLLVTLATTWGGTAPVRITGIAGSTVTVSENWTAANSVGHAIDFIDSIRIVSGATTEYYPANSVAILSWLLTASAVTVLGGVTMVRTTASALVAAYVIGDSAALNSSGTIYGRGRQLALERFLPSQSGFEVSATHGDEYSPPLPLPTTTGLASTQDAFQNGIAWSKSEQPEHAMLAAYKLLGRANVPILRSVALKGGVVVFKGAGDGIYVGKGFGERSGWTWDQVDPETYLLHPELLTVLDGVIYAWTNLGMVAVTEAGVVAKLSEPAIGNLVRGLQIALDHTFSQTGVFAVSNAKDNEVVFGLPAYGAEDARRIFVFNTKTKAWSTWFHDEDRHTCGAYDPDSRLLWFGALGAGNEAPLIERAQDEVVQFADVEWAITITAATGGTAITIAGGSGWTPVVGDLVIRDDVFALVTAVTDVTHFTVGTAITTGAATAYEAFESRLKWLQKTGQGPAVQKRFREVITHWDAVDGVGGWDVTLEANPGPDLEEEIPWTRAVVRDSDPSERSDHRTLVPRSVSLTSQLYPGITIAQADARWRITGISQVFEPITTRTTR